MSILGDIFGIGSSIAGLFGANKSNKQSAAAYEDQKKLAGQQTDLAAIIKQLAQGYNNQGSGYVDAFGGSARYDPSTGTWKTSLGDQQQKIQDSSDAEELNRNTYDAALRRQQLSRANQGAEKAFGGADTALRQYDQLNQGIGTVDPTKLASALRLNRTGAVNAGFDDAQRAANTISVRTGASAGDALSRLGRSRASAIFQAQGDPELEALTAAEGINTGRKNTALGAYNLFNGAGTGVGADTFNPSTVGDTATNNLFKAQSLDQSKFGLVNDALGTSAATIGSAAAGLRGGAADRAKTTNNAALAQFLSSIGSTVDGGGGLGSVLSKIGLG